MAVLQTEQDAKSVQHFVDGWRANAPLQSRLSRLNAEIAQLGQSSGVLLVRFDPQPVVQHASLWHVTTNIGVEGNFSAIFEFVRCLENLGVTAWQDRLQIKPIANTAGADSKLLHCDLSLTVFADRRDFSD